MAGPQPGPPAAGPNGTIDVKPSDLYRVSGGVAAQQSPMDRGAKQLLEKLREYPDAGGYGTAPQAFAASYVKVGNRFLEVWAKSIVSIGGAAVGFTSTANSYAKAEAANDPSGKTKAVHQPLPAVIEKVPDYGSVPNLRWGDDDGGDDVIRTLLEWVPGPVRDVLRPVVKHAFRMGKVAEVYPYPQQHYLNSLSKAWMSMTMTLSVTESALTGNVDSIKPAGRGVPQRSPVRGPGGPRRGLRPTCSRRVQEGTPVDRSRGHEERDLPHRPGQF